MGVYTPLDPSAVPTGAGTAPSETGTRSRDPEPWGVPIPSRPVQDQWNLGVSAAVGVYTPPDPSIAPTEAGTVPTEAGRTAFVGGSAAHGERLQHYLPSPTPLCDIPSGCCSFTGPWTVTRSSLRMLCRVAAFCRPLRPVLLLVSFPRSRSPVVGVLGLC